MNQFKTACAFFVLVLTGLAIPSHAQMGTPRFHFRTRAEVKTAALANLKKPRETYNLIICAGRQGLIGTALQTYEAIVKKDPFNAPPQVQSAYAFSHFLTLYPRSWYWQRERTPGLVRGQWENEGKVTVFRDEALKLMPKSPEVMLEYALWLDNQQEGRPRALKMIEQAITYAPQWAELHYWHALLLTNRAVVFPAKEIEKMLPRYATLSLQALNRAERLDPAFKQEGLNLRISRYEWIGQPQKALAALDAYLRYRPDFAQYKVGNYMVAQVTRKRLVAAIEKAKH